MRFHSTPQSVLNGEFTKLAIIECVVAVALYVGIGVYFHTFRHFAIAVAVAPLMLFRTEASVRWGLEKYVHATNTFQALFSPKDEREPHFSWRSEQVIDGIRLASSGFIMLCAVTVSGFVIKVVATWYFLLYRPLYTLREMPKNWLRQSFCTDLFYPPEILPLEAVYSNEDDVLTFPYMLDYIRTSDFEGRVLSVTLLLPVAVFGWIPSVLYRISFKATSLVYFPFIWVARRTLRSALSVKLRLERITEGELEKTGRALSWLLLIMLCTRNGRR